MSTPVSSTPSTQSARSTQSPRSAPFSATVSPGTVVPAAGASDVRRIVKHPAYTPIRLSDVPREGLRVVTSCQLTASVPAGATLRLTGDSLRSVMSGFEAESIAIRRENDTAGEAWAVRGGRLPRPQPRSGVDRAPRQLLLVACPGAVAGDEVVVSGTFWAAGSQRGPTLAPFAEVPITFRLEVEEAPARDAAGADAAGSVSGGRSTGSGVAGSTTGDANVGGGGSVAGNGAASTGEGESTGAGAAEPGWRAVGDWFGIVLLPGPAEQLEAFVDSSGNVAIGLFDAGLNPAAADVDEVEVVLPDGETRRVPLPAAGEAAYGAVRVPLAAPPAAVDPPASAAPPAEVDRTTPTPTPTPTAPVAPRRPEVSPAAAYPAPSAVVAPGTRILVRDAKGRETLSSPAPIHTVEGERLLFGEFHWHTEASGDGARPLVDSYRSARDGLLLDYAGAADHFPFDPPPGRHPAGLPLRDCADIVDAFDAPGSFVTLLGIELSWRMGHYNFYWADREALDQFVEAWEARRPGPLAGTVYAPDIATFYGLPPEYFERAQPGRTLVIPHHTNVTSENLFTPNGLPVWTHYHWPHGHYDPRFFRLGEIVQGRGCFETEEIDAGWKVKWGAGGGSLRTALARGFRVGFTGGTDNHSGWPGRHAGGWVGLTAVYAGEFSRAGIMQGLYRRRCYATTGVRIVLDFRLNGAPLGSELRLLPAGERRFAIRVHGTAPLERVEIVSQGVTVASLPVDGLDLVTEWIDDRRRRPVHDAYYYLRVRQQDGHCAWASPIWVDLALPDDPNDQGRSYGGPVAWS